MEQTFASIIEHSLATLAYRADVAFADAPADFWTFDAGCDVRTPARILQHMVGLMEMTAAAFSSPDTEPTPNPVVTSRSEDTNTTTAYSDIEKFHTLISDIVTHLQQGHDPFRLTPLVIVQGPIADCLTHVGQLHLLRRLAGAPTERVSYLRVDVRSALQFPRHGPSV